MKYRICEVVEDSNSLSSRYVVQRFNERFGHFETKDVNGSFGIGEPEIFRSIESAEDSLLLNLIRDGKVSLDVLYEVETKRNFY